MGPVYVNTLDVTEQLLLESANAAIRFRRRSQSAILTALALLSLLVGTYLIMQMRWYFFIPYIIAVCFLFFSRYAYRIPVRRVYRSIRGADGTRNVRFVTSFTDRSVEISIDGISNVIPYSRITALVESPNLLTLVIGESEFLPSCIPLNKTLFAGERLDFVLYLRRRVPALRVKLAGTGKGTPETDTD